MAKICKPFRGQLDEQARPVSARGVLAEDDLAFSVTDLADFARTVTFMPALFEAEHLDVEMKSAVHIGDEEHRARIPAVNNLICHGLLCHSQILGARTGFPGATSSTERPFATTDKPFKIT